MREKSLSFLKAILAAPSPSGYEQPVQRIFREYVGGFADDVKTDLHGNVIAAINPSGSPRIMFAGHCDELGFQITYINDNGFLHFKAIGGHDVAIIPGRRVQIHTKNGIVKGVIGKRAIHLMSDEERNKPKVEIESFWIDIAVKDRDEALGLVAVGDPVTYDLSFDGMRNGVVTSRAFDDKAGVFVVAETLRILAENRDKLKAAVFGVSTVQEEIGLRGATTAAFGVDPQIGVAVDVTHATDSPDMDKRKAGEVKLGGGPVITRGANINPVVFDRLVQAASTKTDDGDDPSYQIDAAPRGTGTDANAIQLTRAGVAAGLVSIPLRYMHTAVEMVALADLESSAQLLATFAQAVEPDTSFIPA